MEWTADSTGKYVHGDCCGFIEFEGESEREREKKKEARNMTKTQEKQNLTSYLLQNPDKLAEFLETWRRVTRGMTKEERKDFAKWIDEAKK